MISILVLLLKVQIMVSIIIIVLILLLLELFQRLSLMHSVMKMRTFKTEAAALRTNLIVID